MGTLAVDIASGIKTFGSTTALSGIDLRVAAGEFLAVLGRSGSGKSSLLRVLAGLDTLTSGTIAWDADGTRPRTGVVFQDPLLMPWLSVAENIAFAGRFAAQRDGFDPARAVALTDRFGLRDLAGRYPDELSGGQAQRVAVLRAVAGHPRLLLLDEPFSALDPATRADLQSWLAEVAAELDVTVVLVTHDVDEAVRLADRIVLLGAGRVQRSWQLDDDVRRDGLRDDILAEYRSTATVGTP